MENDDDLSSQEGGPAIPAGVLKTSKKGWGEELEMQHHRNEQNKTKVHYAAVNIKQFQNTEVGAGYQARGVVRQKTAGGDAETVRDLTAAQAQQQKPTRPQAESKDAGNKQKGADEYLKCDGIRNFRKEIEQLLSSATSR